MEPSVCSSVRLGSPGRCRSRHALVGCGRAAPVGPESGWISGEGGGHIVTQALYAREPVSGTGPYLERRIVNKQPYI